MCWLVPITNQSHRLILGSTFVLASDIISKINFKLSALYVASVDLIHLHRDTVSSIIASLATRWKPYLKSSNKEDVTSFHHLGM
jgi:hypothetical protein